MHLVLGQAVDNIGEVVNNLLKVRVKMDGLSNTLSALDGDEAAKSL